MRHGLCPTPQPTLRSAACSASSPTNRPKWGKDTRTQLQTMQRDVISLTDHASYIRNKVTFLLDAMLGVVNLRQNAII